MQQISVVYIPARSDFTDKLFGFKTENKALVELLLISSDKKINRAPKSSKLNFMQQLQHDLSCELEKKGKETGRKEKICFQYKP